MALNLFVKSANSNTSLKGVKLFATVHNLSKTKTVNMCLNTIAFSNSVDSLVHRTTPPQLLPNKNHHIPVMHQEVIGKVFRSF